MDKKELQNELGKHYKSIRETERFWVEFIEDGNVAIQYMMYDNPSFNLCRSLAKKVRSIMKNEEENVKMVMIGDWYFEEKNNWGY